MTASFYIPTSDIWVFKFLYIYTITYLICLSKKIITILGDGWSVSHCGFCTSLLSIDMEDLFICLLIICIFILKKCLLKSFAHILVDLSFCCWIVGVLSTVWILKPHFLLLCMLYFHFLDNVFWCTKIFNFNKVHFI